MAAIDYTKLVGVKVGRLTPQSFFMKGKRRFVVSKCECGNEHVTNWESLRRGATKSCGCIQQEMRTKHGMAHRPEYSIWEAMVSRCTPGTRANLQNTRYTGMLCERWRDFANFFADMGPRPEGMSIDRIDNNKGYFPGNCRWATRKQQQRNRSVNVMITANGETLCASEWAERTGIKLKTIYERIKRGVVGEALLAPTRKDFK